MNIPEGWRRIRLGEIGNFKNGINKGKEDFGFGVPFINLMDVFGKSRIHSQKFGLVNASSKEVKSYALRKGDVLFVRSSVKPSGVGLTSVINEDLEGTIYSGFLIRYRYDHRLLVPSFAVHCFYETGFRQRLLTRSTVSANTNVNQQSLRNLYLYLPPLPEQRKIADILGTWDEEIRLTERLIEAKQTYKKGLMQQLLTGKMRFPGFEGEWEEIRIKDLGQIVSGGTPSTANPDYWDGDINWCTPTDITALTERFIGTTKRKITELGLANSSAKLLPTGSILVCTRATVGDCAIAKTLITTNQGFKNIILNKEFCPNFVYYLLSTMKSVMIRYASGSTFLELSKINFERLKVVVPEYQEQRKIASVLAACDEEISLLQRKAAALREQKKGLMQQLLTGKVRV